MRQEATMALNRKQLAAIHVAKTKLGMSDAEYRTALVHIAGVTRSKELDLDGFHAVMGYFDFLGWKPTAPTGPDYGHRPGMASFAQLELIRNLWSEYTRGQAGEDELSKWLLRSFKVSSLRFLRAKQAGDVITALKAMKARRAG